jgi:trimethylamine:corrinoid methyltransferase-like protein
MGSAMGGKKAQETVDMASIIFGGIDKVRKKSGAHIPYQH